MTGRSQLDLVCAGTIKWRPGKVVDRWRGSGIFTPRFAPRPPEPCRFSRASPCLWPVLPATTILDEVVVVTLPVIPPPVLPPQKVSDHPRPKDSRPRSERRGEKHTETKESPEQIALLRWMDLT